MRPARRGGAAAVTALLARGSTLVLVAALAGCGVPGPGSERVPPSEVPSGLRGPAPARGPGGGGEPERTTGSGATAALLAARAPSVYLLDTEDVLVAVPLEPSRATTAPAQAPPGAAPLGDDEATVLATRLLRSLARSPTADQRDQGLSTALSPGVPASLVDVVGGTARVALRQPDRDPAADRLPLATGQVVLTVTSVPGITHVRLLRGREPTAVVLPGGARSDGPVTALDYADLLAAP